MIRRPPRSTLFPYTTALPISCSGCTVSRTTASSSPLNPSGSETSRSLAEKVSSVLRASYLWRRSEEHTSELQSRQYLVCRLLLEKKKRLQLISVLASPILLTP